MFHHILNAGHSIDNNSLKLVALVRDRRLMEPYEGLNKIKDDNLIMNKDGGPMPFNCLYSFIK